MSINNIRSGRIYYKALYNNKSIGILPPPRVQKTIITQGNAQLDTDIVKYGTASGLFDGNGDFLKCDFTDNTSMNGPSFTIEFWARFDILPLNQTIGGGSYMVLYFSEASSGGSAVEPYFLISNVDNVSFRPRISWGIKRVSSSIYGGWQDNTSSIEIDTWYHVAIVKNDGVWKAYWNGIEMTPDGTALLSTDVPLYYRYINFMGWPQTGRGYWDGNVDEVRFSSIARYTSNFTPPTAPFVHDDVTMLLLHMDGTDGGTTFTDSIS